MTKNIDLVKIIITYYKENNIQIKKPKKKEAFDEERILNEMDRNRMGMKGLLLNKIKIPRIIPREIDDYEDWN